MRDVHVHFLHGKEGEYTEEYFLGFVKKAQEMNLVEIYLLEHTHQFYEFEDIYIPVRKYNGYQKSWLERRITGSVDKYLRFIETVKRDCLPVTVKFGLEVCYIPETADRLADILRQYRFDFLTGSVHWIDGWGFDHPNQRETWNGKNVEEVYKRYYDIMCELCESKLFSGLAHPDSIRCFGNLPSYDMNETYTILSELLNQNRIYAENSGGLRLNYNPELELGLNKQLLDVFKRQGVCVCCASDAHKQSDTGANIWELERMLLSDVDR